MKYKLKVYTAIITVIVLVCSAMPVAATTDISNLDTNTLNLELSTASSSNKYAGVIIGADSYQGISAQITVPSVLPDVENSNEFAWVSTEKDANGEWVQVGAGCTPELTSFRTYFEHYQNGVYLFDWIGTHVGGGTITYKVEYNPNGGKWHAYIGNVDRGGSALSKINSGVQACAEVHKSGIEMGPFTFSTVRVKNGSSVWSYNTVMPTADSPYSVSGGATQFVASGP